MTRSEAQRRSSAPLLRPPGGSVQRSKPSDHRARARPDARLGQIPSRSLMAGRGVRRRPVSQGGRRACHLPPLADRLQDLLISPVSPLVRGVLRAPLRRLLGTAAPARRFPTFATPPLIALVTGTLSIAIGVASIDADRRRRQSERCCDLTRRSSLTGRALDRLQALGPCGPFKCRLRHACSTGAAHVGLSSARHGLTHTHACAVLTCVRWWRS